MKLVLKPRLTYTNGEAKCHEMVEVYADGNPNYPQALLHIDTFGGLSEADRDMYNRMYHRGEIITVELAEVQGDSA